MIEGATPLTIVEGDLMESFRFATFNVENLFARYRFRVGMSPVAADGFTINDLAFDLVDESAKKITAKAIRATKADIVALQEVESLPVLDRFNARYLGGRDYRNRVLVDGNDPRAIDVALLTRHDRSEGIDFTIQAVRSHRDLRRAGAPAVKLFSRDCLEVVLGIPDGNGGAKPFTLFINHFKSMMGGRDDTQARRLEQAQAVHEIVSGRFGHNLEGDFAIVGDLNDYLVDPHGLGPLVDDPNLVNVVTEVLPQEEQWTHYYKGGAQDQKYSQLDYILLSKRVFDAASGAVKVKVIRKGLPHRAERYTGSRFSDIGEHHPKASDHCPVVAELPIGALSA